MSRVTIHLTDQMYRALVEAAAQERCSMDSIVEESLKLHSTRDPSQRATCQKGRTHDLGCR